MLSYILSAVMHLCLCTSELKHVYMNVHLTHMPDGSPLGGEGCKGCESLSTTPLTGRGDQAGDHQLIDPRLYCIMSWCRSKSVECC